MLPRRFRNLIIDAIAFENDEVLRIGDVEIGPRARRRLERMS